MEKLIQDWNNRITDLQKGSINESIELDNMEIQTITNCIDDLKCFINDKILINKEDIDNLKKNQCTNCIGDALNSGDGVYRP
jgi:hypothetical protein